MSTVTRRISFTGRKRISRNDVSIRTEDAPFRAIVSIRTEKWNFPSDAVIVLEANQRMVGLRLEFGTIGCPDIPSYVDLHRLNPDEALSFRLKVVDTKDSAGKILGVASRIQAQSSEPDPDKKGLRAILPLQPRRLDSQIWKVSISSAGPELLINREIPGLKEKFLKDVLLAGAVLPAALRDILKYMCSDSSVDDEENEAWNNWKRFCQYLGAEAFPEEDAESQDEWVEDVVKRFCAKHDFAQRVKNQTSK